MVKGIMSCSVHDVEAVWVRGQVELVVCNMSVSYWEAELAICSTLLWVVFCVLSHPLISLHDTCMTCNVPASNFLVSKCMCLIRPCYYILPVCTTLVFSGPLCWVIDMNMYGVLICKGIHVLSHPSLSLHVPAIPAHLCDTSHTSTLVITCTCHPSTPVWHVTSIHPCHYMYLLSQHTCVTRHIQPSLSLHVPAIPAHLCDTSHTFTLVITCHPSTPVWHVTYIHPCHYLSSQHTRSWQYISCHWDACSNHSVISDCFAC